jgi:hypothetical protein
MINHTRNVPKLTTRFTCATKLTRTLSFVAVLLAASKTARAEELVQRKIGVGYKVGNGLGLEGGDVVLRLLPHIVFDLQASYASSGGASGFGVAPTVQVDLKSVGHTPYVSAGVIYFQISDANSAGHVTGFVANAGYDWRFASGIGLMVGAGVGDAGAVHVTRGGAADFSTSNIGVHFNLEAGVRYFF